MTSAEALQLFKQHEPSAVQIARSFIRNLPKHIELGDLEGAARLGLWRGVMLSEEVVPKDAPPEAVGYYLRTHVRGAIMDDLRRQDWLPRFAHRQEFVPQIVYLDRMAMHDYQRAVREDEPDIAQTIDDKRKRERLGLALFSLRARDREIVLRILDGEKMRDIAKHYGISEPRVSQIFSREKVRLAHLLRKD